MALAIETLDRQGFAPFGKILGDRAVPPRIAGAEFLWEDQAAGLELAAKNCTGILHCLFRERRLKTLECHRRTPEILISLKGNGVLCVAPAGLSRPEGEDIRAFQVEEGMALMMNTGVWHGIPYPDDEEGARFLVLFRDGTGEDDLNFTELADPMVIG